MSLVRLPSAVYDDSLSDFIALLASAAHHEPERIDLDFQDMQFYTPAGLVALLTTIHGWSQAHREVGFVNAAACPILGYLQRMDLFRLSGIKLIENFTRHDAAKRFVSLRWIDAKTAGSVPQLCGEMAACVFPDLAESSDPEQTGPYDMLEFAASELINNVIQHARGPGYAAVQVYPQSGLVRIAVADCGIGIRRSFEESQPPFWDPAMSHLDAVRTALQPRVSSKMHLSQAWGETINAGVGLSVLKQVARNADGLFTLISGNGFFQHNHLEKRRLPTELTMLESYSGTICAIQLSKQKLGNLQQILQTSKNEIGLLRPDQRFDDLFQ
jgi:anti-sigma regulatory factor (Ser/Thr protein kinase)